ncbi:hypothetical protein [Pseudonocardia sp. GCM10023141]
MLDHEDAGMMATVVVA